MKRIYLFFWILVSSIQLGAQSYTPPSPTDIDTNYRSYVNNVFGALEASRVPTGLLSDYGFDFTDPKIYNGTVLVDSTLMEQGLYSELYKTLFTSRFNNNTGTLRHPSIHDSLCYIARQREVITLSGLLFKYNAIDPNAQANGRMQTVNGQLKDVYVNGVWQNPYQEFTTVAISPSIITYKLTYCSVVMPSNLFLSNMQGQISSIQLDADDGQGYRNLYFDVPLSLNYADTGWKHWIFQITLTNGQQLYSHSKVHFNNTSNAAGSGGMAARGVADETRIIRATEQFDGIFGEADIVISYHDATDRVLRRPLIVAEGFDPGWIISPEEPEGENTFGGFVRTVRTSNSLNLQRLIADFVDPNLPSQYDIVYVNWRNGTDWLQRNELVLEEVIRWVNREKQPLGGVRQPNVVLGSSMGGVIARMALGRMERGGGLFNGTGGFAAHETSLFVSLDAPHLGANVPLGYQALARHAARMYISTGPLAVGAEIVEAILHGPSPLRVLTLADQPAARQLLINRIDQNDNLANAPNQQFLQDLRANWAFPQNIRNIAISNGSECAIDQEFAPGSALLYHHRSTKTRFIGDLIFMVAGTGLGYLTGIYTPVIPLIIPGSNKFDLTLDIKSLANGGGNQVYYGNIKLTKKVLWLLPVSINIADHSFNAPSGLLPFDTYPGGFYTVNLEDQPGSVSQDWMFTYDNSFFIQRRFTLVPTPSALNIGGGNITLTDPEYMTRYIGAAPPPQPLNPSFQNFTTAFNIDGVARVFTNNSVRELNNEPHEHFFRRTADWLAAEMAITNPVPQFTDCSGFCENGTITGPENMCTNTQTYSAPFGIGATYNWSVNNPNLVFLNPSGNTIQLTRNGTAAGTFILTVTITGGCIRTPLTLTKTITVGAPTGIAISQYSNLQLCDGVSYFQVLPASGYYPYSGSLTVGEFSGVAPSITWSLSPYSSGTGWSWEVSGNTVTVYTRQTNTVLGLRARAFNTCGSAYRDYSFNSRECVSVEAVVGGEEMATYSLSPNPTSSSLTVSLKHTDPSAFIKEIIIKNKLGITVRQFRFNQKAKTQQLHLQNLPTDIYVIQIFDGRQWLSGKFIKQ